MKIFERYVGIFFTICICFRFSEASESENETQVMGTDSLKEKVGLKSPKIVKKEPPQKKPQSQSRSDSSGGRRPSIIVS